VFGHQASSGESGPDSGLIEACLASVRDSAGLDDESVLPSLRSIVRPSSVRVRVAAQTQQLPSADAIVKSVWAVHRAAVPTPHESIAPAPVTSSRSTKRSLGSRLRWPVFLCGFVAGIFGGVAIMKSPLGHARPVIKTVTFAKNQATHAYAVARARVSD
jgi:hypothetical protein